MNQLIIHLFGPFQVLIGDESLYFEYDAARALLAYLVLDPSRPHRRDALAGLLWPEQPESAARHNLRQVLNRLRRTIRDKEADPPFLLITRKTVQFNPAASFWLDVAEFKAEMAAAQTHHHRRLSACPLCQKHLVRAETLYRGEFLEGFTPDNLVLEDWLRLHREQFHRQAMALLHDLAAYNQKQGSYALMQRYAQRQIALEPWREEAHQQLMWALAAAQQRSAALVQYETCTRILAEEFDVAPTAETTALYQKIKAGKGSLSAQLTLHNLPEPQTPFIGREEEQHHLTQYLVDTRYRLLVLTGEGGVGKSRLAVAAAHQILVNFMDGVWFVPLAGIGKEETAVPTKQNRSLLTNQVATTIATTIKLTFHGSQEPQRQLLDYLQAKEMLLILDNFEHLLPTADFVIDLLNHAPHITILITSRERLHHQAEWVLQLPGLPVPPTSDTAETYSSAELFLERASRSAPQFTPSAEDLTCISHICTLLNGLPLGIELAATWVEHFTCAEIVTAIQQNLDFLTTTMRGIPKRHRSMRAVFEYSWQLLTDQEKMIAAPMSVFRGDFDRQAALTVTQARLPDLITLVHKSLLPNTLTGRYRLHGLLRQFLRQKLDEMPPTAEEPLRWTMQARHSDFYLTLVAEREAALNGQTPQEAISHIQADMDNIRQAWHCAVTQANWPLLQSSLASLARFYQLVGLFHEGVASLNMALEQIQAQPNPDALALFQTELLIEQTTFFNALAMYDQAMKAAQTAVDLAHHHHLPQLTAAGYLSWGQTLWYQGELNAARQQLEQAHTLSQQDTNPSLKADCLRALGSLSLRLGDYSAATSYYEQTLQLNQQIKDRYGESQALRSLGTVVRDQGRFARARSYFEQTLLISREIGDRRGESSALNGLGDVTFYQGDYTNALDCFQQTLYIAQEIGDRRKESIALNNLGIIARDLGDYPHAEVYFEQALRLKRAIGFHRGEGWGLACRSLLCHYLNNNQDAQTYSQRALHIFEELGDRIGQGYALTYLGHALSGLDQLTAAAEAYQRALTIRQEFDQPHLLLAPLAGLARLAFSQGQQQQAHAYVKLIWQQIDLGVPIGLYETFRIYLISYRVLHAHQETRAADILATAHQRLQERAAKIGDAALKKSFLENVTTHQEILSEWERVQNLFPS